MNRKNNFYSLNKLEVIDDIYGETCYVAEIKAAPKHGIEVCFGRPVRDTKGKPKIILTPELVQFIRDTLNHPIADLEVPFCIGSLTKLRRKVQNNPFKTYQKWLDSPSRPSYIVFANTLENPEYVYDYLDRKYVLYNAYMTDLGIPILRGLDEDAYLNPNHLSSEYILTKELVNLLGEYRSKPHKEVLSHLPITDITLIKLRRLLGFDLYTDRNAWFASRIDDLIGMTATEFHKKHTSESYNVIWTVGTWIRRVLALRESGSVKDAQMIALLEKNWAEAGKATRTAIDEHYGDAPSVHIRRAYKILKMAQKL